MLLLGLFSLNLTKSEPIANKYFNFANPECIIRDEYIKNQTSIVPSLNFNISRAWKITFQNSVVNFVPLGYFKSYPYLVWFDISNSSVTTLHSEAFEKMYNLKRLNLSHNKIVEIPENTFQDGGNLKFLYLSNN